MVDGALFDKLEQLARILRKNDKPFGGLQVRSDLTSKCAFRKTDNVDHRLW